MDEKAWSKALPPGHKSVLAAGRQIAASGDAKDAVWGALAVKLPAAAAAAGATAQGLTLASLVKPLAVGLALGSATATSIAGVGWLASSPRSSPPAVLAVPASRGPVPQVAVRAFEPVDSLEPAGPPEQAPATSGRVDALAAPAPELLAPSRATSSVASFPEEAAPSTPESATLRESRRLAEARAAWRGGDARSAIASLAALDRDFPRGVLVQERDALRIQALVALGERARAQALAQRFLSQYPKSPHAEAIRRLFR